MSTPGDPFDPSLPRSHQSDPHFTAAGAFGAVGQIADQVESHVDYIRQVCDGMTTSIAAIVAGAAELQKISMGTGHGDLEAAAGALSASGFHFQQAHAEALFGCERGAAYVKALRGQR